MNKKWETHKDFANSIISRKDEGYYLSYNPDPLAGDSDETALYLYDSDEFLILNGDFREEYEKCKSLKECMEVYEKNKKHRNIWSTDSVPQRKEEIEKMIYCVKKFVQHLKSEID